MAMCLLIFQLQNKIIRFFMGMIFCGEDIFGLTVEVFFYKGGVCMWL